MFSNALQKLLPTSVNVTAEQVDILLSTAAYKARVLELIASARRRIYITALYLQDDEAGREILEALYSAKQSQPQLEIKVFVDGHRAQRGLIGEKGQQLGNCQLYRDLEQNTPGAIDIYGVLVKRKELFGVLHLKGLIFDDTLLYSGASLNTVYLHQQQRYRYDRYYCIESTALSNSLVNFLEEKVVEPGASPLLNRGILPTLKERGRRALQQKRLFNRLAYKVEETEHNDGELQITPLIGCGTRSNMLNATIRNIVRHSQRNLVIFTPYFNLPKVLDKELKRALKRGVHITLVVGDKLANDFYIPEDQPFSKIGLVPYIYEVLLSRFVKRSKVFIERGQLNIQLWRHQDNSFHLKGLVADDQYHLLTGSNLNPRAWGLDLENGLLIQDDKHLLAERWQQERDTILEHTTRVNGPEDLQPLQHYPAHIRDPLRKLQLAQVDKLLKRFL